MKKLFLYLFFNLLGFSIVDAQDVTITFKYDRSTVSSQVVKTAERNLSRLLTEMNEACEDERNLMLNGIGMTDMGRKAVTRLWQNVKFKTHEINFKETDWLWVFNRAKRMQVNNIHMELSDDSPLDGEEQDAVVEFDLTGRIADFRFAFDKQSGESLNSSVGDKVEDAEHLAIIQRWMEQFRTAYNTKDIDFLNMVFADDALIITGNVITVRTAEAGMMQKVNYTKQNKTQYLRNLQRCFARNHWIKVEFSPIENTGNKGKDKYITHRYGKDGKDYYGVRVRQSWKSANGYHDEGYLFVLWEFLNNDEAIIHVRTWQPNSINVNDIFSMEDFVSLR